MLSQYPCPAIIYANGPTEGLSVQIIARGAWILYYCGVVASNTKTCSQRFFPLPNNGACFSVTCMLNNVNKLGWFSFLTQTTVWIPLLGYHFVSTNRAWRTDTMNYGPTWEQEWRCTSGETAKLLLAAWDKVCARYAPVPHQVPRDSALPSLQSASPHCTLSW